MTQRTPWTSSLRTKLTGALVLLLLATALLVGNNLRTMQSVIAELHSVTFIGKERTAHPLLYELERLGNSTSPAETAASRTNLRNLIARTDRQFAVLMGGDADLRVRADQDPTLKSNLEERERLWREDIRPLLQQLVTSSEALTNDEDRDTLRRGLSAYAASVERGLEIRAAVTDQKLEQLEAQQWLFSALVIAILLLALWLSHNIVKRTRELASVAERISAGDLELRAPVAGQDELAMLGTSFNGMTESLVSTLETEKNGRASLQEVLTAIADTINRLSSAAAEILAGTSQQAAGMREQASAVAETVTTVDEVLQTAEQAADRANSVSASSQHAAEVSSSGRKAIDDVIVMMNQVQEQSSSMAEGMLRLAEHGHEIGEIIAAVTDIADQTNLLAVNASIEASRAGEHGKGFTVVASEIKDLADQSKKATSQIRQILGEIQRATNSAVMATEKTSTSVEQALSSVSDGGETIRMLEETITDAARAAAQIAASAAQQTTGMGQIQQAMAHINQASNQNLAATRQTEQAAQDLNELGARLKDLLAGHEV